MLEMSLRLHETTAEELKSRAIGDERGPGVSAALRLSLDRYLSVLSQQRREAARILAPEEIALIVDVLNGTFTRDVTWAQNPQLLSYEVEDALPDGLAEKWGVLGRELVRKLRSMHPATLLAVIDAVECYWNRPDPGDPRRALSL